MILASMNEGGMKVKHTLWFALLICPFAFGGNCPSGQTKDESALVQLEQSWAQALERHDADAVGCLLADEFQLWSSKIAAHKQAADGTEKLLLEWPDRQRIECVLIRERDRRTICISTQVGCAMGCVFCASGLEGVTRNLTAGEILEQMLLLDRLLPVEGSRVVAVSSVGHRIMADVHFDDLQSDRSYNRIAAYGQAAIACAISIFGVDPKASELSAAVKR